MMALYLLLVVAIWVGLSVFLLKSWQRWRGHATSRRGAVDLFCAVLALAWLGGSFWLGGGRVVYYDAQVDRMCREDGGVTVYENVDLPSDEFDRYARRNWSLPSKSGAKEVDLYVAEYTTHFYRHEDPRVSRTEYKIIRRSDEKILGTHTSYGRGGGDLVGPWHGSSYRCPKIGSLPALEPSVFRKLVPQ